MEGCVPMNGSKYLDMVNAQIRDAKENMEILEKSYLEAKAKHDALLNSKESYIRWVTGDNDVHSNDNRKDSTKF